MPGLLADANIQGHLGYLTGQLQAEQLLELLTECGIVFASFADVGLDQGIGDRQLWKFCQDHQWVLFTDNRNQEGQDSLNAVIWDSWREGCLPVLTLANKIKFESSNAYARRVAGDVATLLVDVFESRVRNQPRIYVPLF